MVFSEKLTTPHPEIAEAGVPISPLTESVRFQTIRAAFEASDKTHDDTVEAAYDTANLVRQTLRFASHTPNYPPSIRTRWLVLKEQIAMVTLSSRLSA